MAEKAKRVRTPKMMRSIRINTKTEKQIIYLGRKLKQKGEPDLNFTDTIVTAIDKLTEQYKDGYQLTMPG